MSDQPIQPKRQGVLHTVAMTAAMITSKLGDTDLWYEAFDTASGRGEGELELISKIASLSIVFIAEYAEIPEDSRNEHWHDVVTRLAEAFPEHYRTKATAEDTVKAVLEEG